MRTPTLLSLAMFALFAVSATPSFAQKIFRCVDEKGTTHFGETMPAACAKKSVTEMNKQGRAVREIEATLTPEQRQAREAEAEKQKERDKLTAGQRLKDTALLSSYGAEKEFDNNKLRSFEQLEQQRKGIEKSIQTIDARIAKLNQELEFYVAGKSKNAKARPAPPELTAGLERARQDRANQEAELVRVEKKKRADAIRFDEDKARWKRLKQGLKPGTLIEPEPAPAAGAAPAKTEAPKPGASPAPSAVPAKK